MKDFLAIDWGTTNRRIYRILNGRHERVASDDRGVLSMSAKGYPAEIARLQGLYGQLPCLMAGMVGSNRGWRDAGYIPAAATLAQIAAAVVCPLDDVAIFPGVSMIADDRADVMRGEEVQFLGAAHAELIPPEAFLCQPGTHCKWARISDAAIIDFTTTMTGEIFALLKEHSLLAPDILGSINGNGAFTAGVVESGRNNLLASLFQVRATTLLGLRSPGANAAFVSGLLIGADVRAHVPPGQAVHILAEPRLGPLYAHAIGLVGASAQLVDSEAAFVAGMMELRNLMR